MHKLLIALLGSTALVLAGCQGGANVKSDTKAEAPAKPALSAEAKAAVEKAEADVKAAQAKNALWTTAQDALKKAKEAADKGDSANAMKFAKTASEHAALGMQQQSYPVLGLTK